jgi:hypothetical protein
LAATGLNERLEVVELYDQLQEERLDSLQDDLVTCISGAEGHGGKTRDLCVSDPDPDPDRDLLGSAFIWLPLIRIRIGFNADPDPAFYLSVDPNTECGSDPRAWKLSKIYK